MYFHFYVQLIMMEFLLIEYFYVLILVFLYETVFLIWFMED